MRRPFHIRVFWLRVAGLARRQYVPATCPREGRSKRGVDGRRSAPDRVDAEVPIGASGGGWPLETRRWPSCLLPPERKGVHAVMTLLHLFLLLLSLLNAAGQPQPTRICNLGHEELCLDSQGTGDAAVQVLLAPHPLVSSILGYLPDSVRTKIFAALAVGDVDAAVAAYMAHKGLTDAPRWLQAFHAAFSVANRTVGPCRQVAGDIHAAFIQFGARAEYIAFRARNYHYMSFDLPGGTSPAITQSGYHVVVRVGDRLYDAFTGPAGLTMADYMGRLHARYGYDWSVVAKP